MGQYLTETCPVTCRIPCDSVPPWLLRSLAIATAAIAGTMAGCNSKPTYEFDALDFTPTQDELVEFSLGHYVVPIPVARADSEIDAISRNRVEFSFDLYVLITRDYESQLADMWQRHEGKIRDRVIRVCRKASVEDLQEEGLPTLKSHLMDAVQAQLGPKSIRRLLVNDASQQRI